MGVISSSPTYSKALGRMMNKELVILNKLDTALARKQDRSLSGFGLFSRSAFASGNTGAMAQFNGKNNQVPYLKPEMGDVNSTERLAREHQMRKEEEFLEWKDNNGNEDDLTEFMPQEKTKGTFQRSSERAMQVKRVESSQILFDEHFIFDASSNTCTLCTSSEKIYCKDVKFHHLLESFAAHVHQAYFKDNSKRLKLIYPLATGEIKFSLGLYRHKDPAKPQVHIYYEDKMFKYEDILFVKDPTKSLIVAQSMIRLLSIPVSDIQKNMDYLPTQNLTEILKFLMLTHVAETYRPAEHGPLAFSDCSPPSQGVQLDKRILSRTPGSGKLTRAFIDLVSIGEASFSIDSLQKHLLFVPGGGTAQQRKYALGLIPPSTEGIDVECNMSKTSEEFITSQLQQLKEGEEKVFDICLGSTKIDFTIKKDGGYYQYEILSIDDDLEDTIGREIIQTRSKELIEKSIRENTSDCVELIFKGYRDLQSPGCSM